jgi:voltage-gated potassium channel
MVVLALLVVGLLPLANEGWVRTVNLTIWAVFVADYFVRLALSTDRRRYFRANLIDLIAIMPVDFFRALRVLRLARLLRVMRAATILVRVSRDVRGVTTTNDLGWVLVIALGTVLGGAVTVWLIEPTIGSLLDALWWATVTATTVGYGDLSPESGLARAVAIVLMLVGIGTIGMLTGTIATYFLSDGAASDPDIEHVRGRLGHWATLTTDERRRLITVLTALTDADAQRSETLPAPANATTG